MAPLLHLTATGTRPVIVSLARAAAACAAQASERNKFLTTMREAEKGVSISSWRNRHLITLESVDWTNKPAVCNSPSTPSESSQSMRDTSEPTGRVNGQNYQPSFTVAL